MTTPGSLDDFVLDLAENPHPKMLAGALRARDEAIRGGRTAHFYWRGYLAAMADATGETAEDIERWMDRNEPAPPESMSVGGRTPVAVPVRRSRSDDPASDGAGA